MYKLGVKKPYEVYSIVFEKEDWPLSKINKFLKLNDLVPIIIRETEKKYGCIVNDRDRYYKFTSEPEDTYYITMGKLKHEYRI